MRMKMRDNNLELVNDKYSGGGQDIFVMPLEIQINMFK